MHDRSGWTPLPGIRGHPCTSGRRESPAAARLRSLSLILSDVIAEPLEGRSASAPVGQHLDPHVEVYTFAHKSLDFLAGGLTQLADPGALRPDDYPLLAVPLDVNHRPNVPRRSTFAELLDADGDAVRDFVMQLLEDRFADHLGDEEPDRLRADIVIGIQKRAFGKRSGDVLNERI